MRPDDRQTREGLGRRLRKRHPHEGGARLRQRPRRAQPALDVVVAPGWFCVHLVLGVVWEASTDIRSTSTTNTSNTKPPTARSLPRATARSRSLSCSPSSTAWR